MVFGKIAVKEREQAMGLLGHLFKKETGETKGEERVLQIVAVTGPGGVTGNREPGEKLWMAAIVLTAWRLAQASAPVHEEPKRLMLEVDDERLKWLQRMIKKDSVVRLQVREAAGGFWLEEVLESFCADVEMQEICRQQQEPVYYTDPVLGEFRLNRATGAYEKQLLRPGTEVCLSFVQEEEERRKLALETARILTENLEFWVDSAASYAADQLLKLKNEAWMQEHDTEISREAFLSALWLNDIQVMAGGGFRFWYSDGNLFGGKSVFVDGSVYGRFSRAGI